LGGYIYFDNLDFKLKIEDKTDDYKLYIDVDYDGYITACDAAIVLQKTLNADFEI
jgi:hypothetical protein